MNIIRIKAPATVANLVCGFDILGLCLEEPYDIMEVTLLNERKVTIRSNDNALPTDPTKNTAGAPLLEIIRQMDAPIGFDVYIEKRIKPGSGIGSSAANAAGAVVAANHLLENKFSNQELVQLAMHGERIASGADHADNIAPCIYGSVTLIRSTFPLEIIPISAPPLFVTIVHPQIEIKTVDARRMLPAKVPLKDAITQWGNIAGLIAGLMKNDNGIISRSLQDVIIEPVRSSLIPGFKKVKTNCMNAGALGGGISGSGPAIFMLSTNKETATAIALEMEKVFNELAIENKTYVSVISKTGVSIID